MLKSFYYASSLRARLFDGVGCRVVASSAIHDTDFENAIYCIQMGIGLSHGEEKVVSHLVIAPSAVQIGNNETVNSINKELHKLRVARDKVAKT
jgi:hypothetical protein